MLQHPDIGERRSSDLPQDLSSYYYPNASMFENNEVSQDTTLVHHTRHKDKDRWDSLESIFNTRVDTELQSMMLPNTTYSSMTTSESFYDMINATSSAILNVTGLSCKNSSYINVTCELPITYAQPMYGYIAPFLLATTIVANTLIVVVLSRRHMRTPTNAVLMAMALCDMFTLLFPAPWLFYMYTFGNHYKPLTPIEACYAFNIMHEVIPAMFHTASIWLTLALAVQRYIYVCHAPVARTWCTMPRVTKCITYIGILAVVHQSTRFFDRTFHPVKIVWNNRVEYVCHLTVASWVEDIFTQDVYFITYYMFRVIFVHLIPCVSLVVLNVLLFRAMRAAQNRRRKLFKENRKSECSKLRDSNCTTLMLIVVVTVFLLVEIPVAVVTILHMISSGIVEILDYDKANLLIMITNFFIMASYPVNFAIYCGMSRQFRETFKELFVRGTTTTRKNGGSSRYSLVNGPRTCTNETVL